MSRWTDDELNHIFDRTSGKCHLCHKRLAWKNYGSAGRRGAWHVDHSNALARGGVDDVRNALPACVHCNTSKQDRSNRSVRAAYGKIRAPLSHDRGDDVRLWNALFGGSIGWALGQFLLGSAGAILATILGALAGFHTDPDKSV